MHISKIQARKLRKTTFLTFRSSHEEATASRQRGRKRRKSVPTKPSFTSLTREKQDPTMSPPRTFGHGGTFATHCDHNATHYNCYPPTNTTTPATDIPEPATLTGQIAGVGSNISLDFHPVTVVMASSLTLLIIGMIFGCHLLRKRRNSLPPPRPRRRPQRLHHGGHSQPPITPPQYHANEWEEEEW